MPEFILIYCAVITFVLGIFFFCMRDSAEDYFDKWPSPTAKRSILSFLLISAMSLAWLVTAAVHRDPINVIDAPIITIEDVQYVQMPDDSMVNLNEEFDRTFSDTDIVELYVYSQYTDGVRFEKTAILKVKD